MISQLMKPGPKKSMISGMAGRKTLNSSHQPCLADAVGEPLEPLAKHQRLADFAQVKCIL